MPKIDKKKNTRRKIIAEKEQDAMSAEQINIITPNGPTFEQETVEKHNSSIHSLSEGAGAPFAPGEIEKKVRITLTPRNDRSISEKAKTPRVRNVLPINMFNNDDTMFRKQPLEPALLDLKVLKEDYDHLMQADLDPISKNEVVYKILKTQLREQQ